MTDSGDRGDSGDGMLSGIKVLDLSTILAAPLSASLLADFGADVIKVEEPVRGDTLRRFAPLLGDESLTWRASQRNKRSITIDLRAPDAAALVYRMIASVDVVITNYRLPTLRRWRLDYEDCLAHKPDLVMLHLTAFGRTGPWSDKPGFARVAEAFAGLTHITGYADRPPVFNGFPIGDAMAGIYGAFAVMLALHHRDRSGEGQLIDLALYEPIVRVLEDMFVDYGATGRIKERRGNEQDHSCPNDIFPTADGGWVVIPASTENMWSRLCSLIDDPELESLATTAQRVANRRRVDDRIAAFTSRFDTVSLLALFDENEIAAGPLHNAAEVVSHPQVRARVNFSSVWDPELRQNLTVQSPVPTFSRKPGSIRRPAPRLGEHTAEVLRELGLAEDEISRMRAAGTI